MSTSGIRNRRLWKNKYIGCQKRMQNDEKKSLVKWAYLSYLCCSWGRKDLLVKQTSNGVLQINTFKRKFGVACWWFDTDEEVVIF